MWTNCRPDLTEKYLMFPEYGRKICNNYACLINGHRLNRKCGNTDLAKNVVFIFIFLCSHNSVLCCQL